MWPPGPAKPRSTTSTSTARPGRQRRPWRAMTRAEPRTGPAAMPWRRDLQLPAEYTHFCGGAVLNSRSNRSPWRASQISAPMPMAAGIDRRQRHWRCGGSSRNERRRRRFRRRRRHDGRQGRAATSLVREPAVRARAGYASLDADSGSDMNVASFLTMDTTGIGEAASTVARHRRHEPYPVARGFADSAAPTLFRWRRGQRRHAGRGHGGVTEILSNHGGTVDLAVAASRS